MALQRLLWSQRYRHDPQAFARDCIDWPDGEHLTIYQDETLGELIEYGKVLERGPHGLGKTTTAAIAILWFAFTSDGWIDWKNPVTASKWRHLEKYLWPEVHKWVPLLRWDRMARPPVRSGRELLDLELNLATGSAFAVASDDPANIEGAHARRLFYVYDEGKTIQDGTWDASEGAFANAGEDTGNEAFALAFSTPGEPAGRFFVISKRSKGYEDWHTRHVTLEEAIDAGRVSRTWAEARLRQWGASSPVYQNRVLGEFAEQATDSVIPLAWVEQANDRWERIMGDPRFAEEWIVRGELPEGLEPFTCAGVDVADEGEDETVIALRHGPVIVECRQFSWGDTMETAGRVTGVLRARGGYAVIDSIGIGAGVTARLRELTYEQEDLADLEVFGFVASEGSDRTDMSGEMEFANRRAEAWWALREQLDPTFEPTLALPPIDRLTGDLTTPKWKMTSGGRILIESKDDIRKRNDGRSTDYGDAVVMACWDPPRKKRARLLG